MAGSRGPDRRIDRTRQAILDAFRDELLQRGYERITVRGIVKRANVGRSTFYEHFENRDDVLRQSLSVVFTPLADTIGSEFRLDTLKAVLEHFWRGRRLTRAMAAGAARRTMVEYLGFLFEERLQARALDAPESLVPFQLITAHLAANQLALIDCWFASKPPCSAESLAYALYVTTNALAEALLNTKSAA
jgi:AcrR family transcriptional regulator